MPTPASQIRLLLIEDVPQVAQYVRGLLNSQAAIRLLDVVTDGRQAVPLVSELRPDVVIIDALLQGKVKGLDVAQQVRQKGINVPVVILTVPQKPVQVAPDRGVDRVLTMPFSGYDLVNLLQTLSAERQASGAEGSSRVYSIFAAKGGIGRTTIAFNLAVTINQQSGLKTVLVDGSIQYGDMRALLKVPHEAPSILDLPTDRIQESDLSDVLWRDPSGIDILLAPPRVEMAEMVTSRDVDKVLSILRRVYQVVIIDTPTALSDVVLTFLDNSDALIHVVTFESTVLYNTRAVGETFRAIGYPVDKIRYLLNRADSAGGMDPKSIAQALGRDPEFHLSSDGRLVVESNNQGVPFVLANPQAAISQELARVAEALTEGAAGRLPAAARR
ncbi:MAG: response regulator [Chloroflexi bacterium]|nr:response regulator [Chloroflexota bacterium]